MKNIQGKSWYRSKSIWFGLALIALSTLEYFQETAASPNTLAIVGILIVVLRTITTEKITFK